MGHSTKNEESIAGQRLFLVRTFPTRYVALIDGFNDRRNAVTFSTNPYGTQRDLLSFDDVYNHVTYACSLRATDRQQEQHVIGKLSYLKQF